MRRTGDQFGLSPEVRVAEGLAVPPSTAVPPGTAAFSLESVAPAGPAKLETEVKVCGSPAKPKVGMLFDLASLPSEAGVLCGPACRLPAELPGSTSV